VKFSRRVKPEVDVNLTPLIDVVFLLLIFFMVSTTFTKDTQLSIDLPEASGVEAAVADRQIEITVSRNGDYAINAVALASNRIDTLKAAIGKVSGGDTTVPLIITADSAAQHQAVVTAMDAAGQLGFSKLRITTKNTSQDD
jgi:biopolymer transport protein ExbD|tara:strand:+ start:6044 stop:6466 length:423 start_codon:yes stop_codon:yes gene_type:complete